MRGLHAEVLAEVDAANVVVLDDFFGPAAGEYCALVDDVGAVADAQRFTHVVVGDQHADAALLEIADDALDVEHGDGVDARERLVEQDESGLGPQRARNFEAPTLAAGERQGGVLAQVGNAQLTEQLGQALLDLRRREPLQLEHRLHVFLHRKLAEDGVLLRQIGDAEPCAAMNWHLREVALVEVDEPRVCRDQPDDHVEAGGLAGAVGAEQADHFAARDFQGYAFDDGARFEALAQVLRAQNAHFSSGFDFGWITAFTRPPGAVGAAPFAALTEKNSVRWSRKMYSPFTTSWSRVTRARSNSSMFSLRSSISMRSASPSVQTPSLSSFRSPFWRKRTGLPVAVVSWKPSASWCTTMRSARTTMVPFVSTTLPSKMLMRFASSELILFASILVGLSLSAFSAATGKAASSRIAAAKPAMAALFGGVTVLAWLFPGFESAAHPLAEKQFLRVVVVLHSTARQHALLFRDHDIAICAE